MIRISISEASRLFGVSNKTIRRAINGSEINYVVVQGRYKLSFESMVKWSQKNPHAKRKLADKGIGQYVGHWKIKNRLYSPNPRALEKSPQND